AWTAYGHGSEPARSSLEYVAAAGLGGGTGWDRHGAVGLGGASGAQGGPDAVLDVDGESRLGVGFDIRRAGSVVVGGDSARVPARIGGQHSHLRPDAPLPVVPPEPVVDELAAALCPAVEPGRLQELRCGVLVGGHVAVGGAVVRGRASGVAVVWCLRRLGSGVGGNRSSIGWRRAS